MHANSDGMPSYRLLPALRLACLNDSELVSEDSERILEWKRQVAGLAPWEDESINCISEWEAEMRDLLVRMCDWIVRRGEEGLMATEAVRDRLREEGKRYEYAVNCIWQLWDEEVWVARAVRERVDSGQSFW